MLQQGTLPSYTLCHLLCKPNAAKDKICFSAGVSPRNHPSVSTMATSYDSNTSHTSKACFNPSCKRDKQSADFCSPVAKCFESWSTNCLWYRFGIDLFTHDATKIFRQARVPFPNRLAKGHREWHEQETSLPLHQRRKDLAAMWPCFQMLSSSFKFFQMLSCQSDSLNVSESL